MPGLKRGAIIGVLAATAAGAALVIGAYALHSGKSPFSLFDLPATKIEAVSVCLKSDIRFVEGATKRCYAPADVEALMDRAVLDNEGRPVTISLSHPTDYGRDMAIVRTCNDYRARTREGWFALSSREMRREAFFERACGALDMIARARRADVSYFAFEACSQADIESLAADAGFWIGEAGEAAPAEISRVSETEWRLSARGQVAHLQEFAHADFNGDGRGDILAYVYVRVEDGTAAMGAIGILDKPARDGPVRFIGR